MATPVQQRLDRRGRAPRPTPWRWLARRLLRHRALLHSCDEVALLGDEQLYMRGWAAAEGHALQELAVTCNGRPLGTALLGIRRPDVLRVLPVVGEERVGFAFCARVPGPERDRLSIELRYTTATGRVGRTEGRYSFAAPP